MPTTAAPAERYESVAAVRAAHTVLLAAMPDEPEPDDLERAADFIRRATASGAALDAPEDRELVQGLIDYWLASLAEYRGAAGRAADAPTARVKAPPAVLAEFDRTEIAAAIARADAWLGGPGAEFQPVARRLLLRLVRMRPDEPVFDPVPVPRAALSDVTPKPDEADTVLRELLDAGVVRLVGAGTPGEQVALRAPELMTEWSALAGWLEGRMRFRIDATGWAGERARATQLSVSRGVDRIDNWLARTLSRFGRSVDKRLMPLIARLRRLSGLMAPSDMLLKGDPLEEARSYRDRNTAERQFTEESRYQQQIASDRNRVLMGLFAVATIAAVVGWIAAVTSLLGLKYEAAEAKRNQELAEKNLKLVEDRRGQSLQMLRQFEQMQDETAVLLERVLRTADNTTPLAQDDQKRLNKIRSRQNEVKALRDPSLPLRPGCRVWIIPVINGKPAEGGEPATCSVCCIVRPIDGGDKRFAVIYFAPLVREKGGTFEVCRPNKDALILGRTSGDPKEHEGPPIGVVVEPTGDDRTKGPEIALIELTPNVPADNKLEVRGPNHLLTGPATDTATGAEIFLIASSSGVSQGNFGRIEDRKVLYGLPDATVGDRGGPVIDASDRLIALHVRSNKDKSHGYAIGPWLAAHRLELIPPTK